MKNKKQTTESLPQQEDWAQATYRTGSTQPPKSWGGLIAFLLALVIFLSGIVTGLSLMNIRLFQRLNTLEATDPGPVAFSEGAGMETPANAEVFPLGFSGLEVSVFWQTYRNLPAGIYVVEVTDSMLQQVCPGDILVQADSISLIGIEDLKAVLQNRKPGDIINAVLYRDGENIPVTLTVNASQED